MDGLPQGTSFGIIGSVDMQNAAGYCERIPHLMRELKTKSLSEAERDRNITKLDYLGIGYGYNFKSNYPKNMKQAEKDTQTPELNKLEKLIEAMET
jgi:hypothetical protein